MDIAAEIIFLISGILLVIKILSMINKWNQKNQRISDQQSVTPTPKKSIIWTIITIAIVVAVIIVAAHYLIPKEEVPEIPMTCVEHLYDFSNQTQMNKVKICAYTEIFANSVGHLIVKTKNKDKSAAIYIALDKELQEKKSIGIECTIKISGDKQSAFSGYVKDSSLRGFTFNGKKIDFFFNGQVKDDLYYNGGMENGEYKISLTRTISKDKETAELRASVDPSFGEKYEKKSLPYDLFSEKNPKRIGLQLFSGDGQNELEISEIKIYASIDIATNTSTNTNTT